MPPNLSPWRAKALHLGPRGMHALGDRTDVQTCAYMCKHPCLGVLGGPQLPSRPRSGAAPAGPSGPQSPRCPPAARRITQLRARNACTHREPSAPLPPYTSTRRVSPATAAIPLLRLGFRCSEIPEHERGAPPRPPTPPRGTARRPRPEPSPLPPPSARPPSASTAAPPHPAARCPVPAPNKHPRTARSDLQVPFHFSLLNKPMTS